MDGEWECLKSVSFRESKQTGDQLALSAAGLRSVLRNGIWEEYEG